MNEVFLEGVIVSVDKPESTADQNHHLVCQLLMSHRPQQGKLKHDLYAVHAWNRLADWAARHITTGTPVFIKGYLTQRNRSGAAAVEIAASRFVIRQVMPHEGELQPSPFDA